MATNKMTIAEIRSAIRGLDNSPHYHAQDMVRCIREIPHRAWLRDCYTRRINEVQALAIPARFIADKQIAERALIAARAEVAALDAMA